MKIPDISFRIPNARSHPNPNDKDTKHLNKNTECTNQNNFNQNNTPNKTPGAPFKSKEDVRQNTSQSKEYAKQNTGNKYVNAIYAVLPRVEFCREFMYFIGIQFSGQKNAVAYKK